ncbi:MAG: hypothetical protein RR390_00625 [Hafnia sp.]
MKPATEVELVAARALAKKLIAELKSRDWQHRDKNESAAIIADAVRREARNSGLNPLLIKSYMLRLQDGRV